MDKEQRDEIARTYEHLWLSDLRKHPGGEVRLFSADGKLVSGTYAFQVVSSIDAMVQAATGQHRTITTAEELNTFLPDTVFRSPDGRLYTQATDQRRLDLADEGWYAHADVIERERELIVIWEPETTVPR